MLAFDLAREGGGSASGMVNIGGFSAAIVGQAAIGLLSRSTSTTASRCCRCWPSRRGARRRRCAMRARAGFASLGLNR